MTSGGGSSSIQSQTNFLDNKAYRGKMNGLATPCDILYLKQFSLWVYIYHAFLWHHLPLKYHGEDIRQDTPICHIILTLEQPVLLTCSNLDMRKPKSDAIYEIVVTAQKSGLCMWAVLYQVFALKSSIWIAHAMAWMLRVRREALLGQTRWACYIFFFNHYDPRK